jgi:hypothetical protein
MSFSMSTSEMKDFKLGMRIFWRIHQKRWLPVAVRCPHTFATPRLTV